jgi:hypothetical protein
MREQSITFPGRIADVDELTVPAADGVPLHVSCTGEGAEVAESVNLNEALSRSFY